MAVKTRLLTTEEAERRQAALQKAEDQQARRDGADLAPQQKLDSDLKHLANPAPLTPVRSVRRRQPHEVPLVYMGRHRGALHDHQIDLNVPDETNAEQVAALADIIDPGVNPATNEPFPLPDLQQIHAHGPSYHFKLNEATLVDAEDVPFFEQHPTWKFRRSDRTEQDATPAPRKRRTG